MKRGLKLVSLGLLLLSLFSGINGFAQSGKKKRPRNLRETERKSMLSRDSVFQALNRSDTSINNLLQNLQQYTTTFNQINNSLAEGLDTGDVSQRLPTVIRRISRITALANTHKSSTLRYLFVLRDNLDRLQNEMDGWQNDLDDVNTKLVLNQNDILKFSKDSLLKVAPTDSALRVTFFQKRDSVRALWRKTDSINRKDLFSLNLLQNKVGTAYTDVLDETDQIDSKIKRFAVRAISGEYDFIWVKNNQYSSLGSALNGTIRLNGIQAAYFFKNEFLVHAIALAFLIIVGGWIFYNKIRSDQHEDHKQIIIEHGKFVYKKPIISGLLVTTTIAPYFYSHPPIFFIESLFIISAILVLIMVKSFFPRSLFNFLFGLFWITVIYCLSNLLIQITNADRYLIAALSVASISFASIFYIKIKKEPHEHVSYARIILKVFILMQLVSFILNIAGRFSLAKIIGVTAVFNLWLTISLYFVIRILIQTLFLQLHTQKSASGFISLIDYNILQKKLRYIITIFASLLWIFFLLQNLNIDDWLRDYLTDMLNQTRSIGGSSFTFGGFVIFFAVIWLSSLLSKLISYFYDISARHDTDISVLKKKNRVSTLLIRIGVFSIGFLLAVSASGFPLDKLTIIFSAFGVGIGFGLQNVTNNLVSGMILAFEKPIQIGDIIEVNNRTGTVKEIGIRASKLTTGNGSEVIIPNGDLLSQNVVNWTLTNTNRQVEVLVSVAYGADIEKVTQLLKDVLSKRDDIMMTPEPSVFLSGITDKSVDFQIFFWAADIAEFLRLRSLVLADIHETLKKKGINLPKSKD